MASSSALRGNGILRSALSLAPATLGMTLTKKGTRFFDYREILYLAKKTLTKQEHIDYWLQTANRDWRTVRSMLNTREYVPALFWSHLMLEKLFKAHWIKDNEGNHPPKIHNLRKRFRIPCRYKSISIRRKVSRLYTGDLQKL